MADSGDRPCRNSGQILWELLLIVFISTQVCAGGFQLLHFILSRQRQNLERMARETAYQDTLSGLQLAFDQRYANPFSSEPWLSIQTGPGDDWFTLESLTIVIVRNDEIVDWKWEGPARFSILVNRMGEEFHAGEFPEGLRIRFADSTLNEFSDGIAIEGIW